MKNKAPLPLMEQLIMILVFALAAALCLQGFSLASRMSRSQEAQNHAVLKAQNAAETLKHVSGDYERASEMLGGHTDGKVLQIPYDSSWQILTDSSQAEYVLKINPVITDSPLLGSACVGVYQQERPLFELTIAWQIAETGGVAK